MCFVLSMAQSLQGQCPNIHVSETDSATRYGDRGWDTAITCLTSGGMTLHADAFITTQNFNGVYAVEEIPYNPPEPFTFGTRMPLSTDDDFAPQSINISFPFCFFGVTKSVVTLGANGMATFATGAAGQHCDYNRTQPIPWSSSYANAIMRDAIYGVYEDTYPYNLGNSARGIYYGSSPQSDYPCRHICFSWNRVPQYNKHSSSDSAIYNCTYQIVIYEGTNIVEVHVKKRKANPSWQNGMGIIGIMNATGTVDRTAHPTWSQAATAAYYPAGFNTFNTDIDERAWRFTPQGNTSCRITWYKLDTTNNPAHRVLLYDANENVIDSMYATELPMMDYEAAEYVTTSDYTECYVRPTATTTYICRMRYYGATGYFYDLQNRIVVGCDTNSALALRSDDVNVCQGQDQVVQLNHPMDQTMVNATWSAYKIRNGQEELLPAGRYRVANDQRSITINGGIDPTLPLNYVDTTRVDVTVNFTNGCSNTKTIYVYAYPNYDFTDTVGICQGRTYTFCGHQYTNTGYYTTQMQSIAGCDSVRHLDLTVFDISYNIDEQEDCKPYTWPHNGITYYASNTATAQRDTVRLVNRYGCDSIVQLSFTLKPVHAVISADPLGVRLENLEVNLIDVSTGNDSRTWLFADGSTSESRSLSYAFPASQDSVQIIMTAHSPLGCDDDTSVVIRMLKETYWAPNVFTPDENRNNVFNLITKGVETFEMWIYNRWGELVYYTNDPAKGWDGRKNDQICEQGAYVYLVRFTSVVHPSPQNVKGTVTLLR